MAKAKIVVADDDQDLRDSVRAILGGYEQNVVTAANKTEGMETIRGEKPDLAILDVMMSS